MYYVVFQRLTEDGYTEDSVYLFDRAEAESRRWVDENGRVWVVPPEKEGKNPTFVFEFDRLSDAAAFYTTLAKNEMGMKVSV